MTWEEIQIASLQKMFLIQGDTLTQNSTTQPYIKAMPFVANEALQLLSTAGKYIVKSVIIEQDGTSEIATKYDMNELTDDFYSFGGNRVYFNNGTTSKPTTYYMIIGPSIFSLHGNMSGKWEVFYNAYPKGITKDTPLTENLTLDKEVAVLVPLYIASQLYKDDDSGLATQWRNEFEVARDLLVPNVTIGTVEFGEL